MGGVLGSGGVCAGGGREQFITAPGRAERASSPLHGLGRRPDYPWAAQPALLSARSARTLWSGSGSGGMPVASGPQHSPVFHPHFSSSLLLGLQPL